MTTAAWALTMLIVTAACGVFVLGEIVVDLWRGRRRPMARRRN
jgi:hypothetical protein